jgi:hypothetical protein
MFWLPVNRNLMIMRKNHGWHGQTKCRWSGGACGVALQHGICLVDQMGIGRLMIPIDLHSPNTINQLFNLRLRLTRLDRYFVHRVTCGFLLKGM